MVTPDTLKMLISEECYAKKKVVDIEGIAVNFIDIDSLIKTKLATDRPQDKADATKLAKKKGK